MDEKQIKNSFRNLITDRDVAALLGTKYSSLKYFLYVVGEENRYKTFQIPKKNGQLRKISTPIPPIKNYQKKFSQMLEVIHNPKPSAHGFTKGRSVITNATVHVKKKLLLNIDILDFFPSINFGRVRGLFMAKPYNLPPEVATILAQLCCHKNQLPQGAPTSPIISNLICSKLDTDMQRFAGKYRCSYTRYVDDISLSTNKNSFSDDIVVKKNGTITAGEKLEKVIKSNGFELNMNKIRLQKFNSRQSVTGLIVNEFPNIKRKYVRQIRGMLHSLAKYGPKKTEAEFQNVHYQKSRNSKKRPAQFLEVLKGKIDYLGLIRGRNDSIYLKFTAQYKKLHPDIIENPSEDAVVMEYDAFLCHATEDKEAFVKPLSGLLNKNFKIWYDEISVLDGDNIFLEVNKGLANCRCGIVVLSKAFFTKGWPQDELSALFTRRIHGKLKIIPIFYNIDLPEVLRHLPIMSSIKGHAFPKKSIGEINRALYKTLSIKTI